MGGLPRRATIIEGLNSEPSNPLVVVDAGNFSWKSGQLSAAARPQQRRKAQLILDAFVHDSVDALGIGTSDLVLGVDWLQGEITQRELPATLANLTCGEQRPFPGHQVVVVDGARLGFVGVLSDSAQVEGCAVSNNAQAVRAEMEAMGEVDLLVVFGHGTNSDDETLASAVTEIDVIINGQARVTRVTPKSLPNGAVQLGAGSRGKKLGVAELILRPGAEGFSSTGELENLRQRRDGFVERLASAENNLSAEDASVQQRAERQVRYFTEEIAEMDAEIAALTEPVDGVVNEIRVELTELSRSVRDHPAVAGMLEQAQADITALEQAAAVPELGDTPYMGSAACSGCHAEIYAQWQSTAHARAYATLQVEERELDRDCFSCHVTGAMDPTGPQHPSQVPPHLQGVGCESCHGAGRDHMVSPAEGGMVRSPPQENCVQCHDGKQDEGRFDWERYLPMVQHQSPQ